MIARRRRGPALAVAVAVGLATPAACGGADAGGDGGVREFDGLAVVDAWTRPTPGGIDTAAIYVTVENRSAAADSISGASSPQCATVVPHRTEIDDDGVASMPSTVGDELDLPVGGRVEMAPNGLHLMCLGLGAALEEGDDLDIQLDFRRHEPITFAVVVERR